MSEKQGADRQSGAERAAAEAMASIQLARDIVAASRSLLLGEITSAGEPLIVVSEAQEEGERARETAPVQNPQIEAG